LIQALEIVKISTNVQLESTTAESLKDVTTAWDLSPVQDTSLVVRAFQIIREQIFNTFLTPTLPHQVSISSTLFEQILQTQIPKEQKRLSSYPSLFCFRDLHVQKLLIEL
jgi:hypothetical protein